MKGNTTTDNSQSHLPPTNLTMMTPRRLVPSTFPAPSPSPLVTPLPPITTNTLNIIPALPFHLLLPSTLILNLNTKPLRHRSRIRKTRPEVANPDT